MAGTWVVRGLHRREEAVDACRGLAIVGMILVNHPVPGRPTLSPLVHAPWHGVQLADVVFPAFLFLVGVAVALTAGQPTPRPWRAAPYSRVGRRVLALFALNLVLTNFPYYHPGSLKLTGVLAQIGWAYLVVALAGLHLRSAAIGALWLVSLLLPWAIFAIGGTGAWGDYSPMGNTSRQLDTWLFGRIVQHLHDSDVSIGGLTLTLGTVASATGGLLAGRYLLVERATRVRVTHFAIAGVAALATGLLWGSVMPLNKPLWTGSYVLVTSGWTLLALAALYALSSCSAASGTLRVLRVAGVNALAFYLLAWALQRVIALGRWTTEDGTTTVHAMIRAWWPEGRWASFAFSLVFLAVCYAAIWLLDRRRLYFKV